MRIKLRSKLTSLPLVLLSLGIAMLVASNSMVTYVDRAPIPDAIDRWGPDGYSYGHSFVFIGGITLALISSLIIEVIVFSTSSKGFNWFRWFAIFSTSIFVLGSLLVWGHWEAWVEARGYGTR